VDNSEPRLDRVEEPVEVDADTLTVMTGGVRRHGVMALVLTAALALGVLALTASFVPGLPGFIRTPNQHDLRWSPLIGLGLWLLIAFAILAGLGVRARGRALLLVAAGVPLGVGMIVAATQAEALTSPAIGTSPLVLSLLVAAPVASLGVPLTLWAAERIGPAAATGPVIALRVELGILGGLVAIFAFAVGLAVLQHLPLGWDESVYALITRHWLFATPATGWGFHRPVVLSILAVIPELVSRDESLVRIIGLLCGCLTVGAVWLLGRRLQGPIVGLVAALVLASAQPIQVDAGFLLNDVPALGVLLLLMAVMWRELEEKKSGWSMLWLAPIAALAFYVRYGASIPILLIAVTSLVIWWRRIASDWPKALATGGVLVLLLLPHLVFSTTQTGTPWGIGLAASGGARPAYPGEGLVTYLAWLPYHLLGPLGAVIAVIGLVTSVIAITRAIRSRGWDRTTRALAFLFIPAVGQIGVLGVSILPQSRYIYFGIVLLLIAGAIGLARGWSALGVSRRPVGWLASGLLTAYLVGSLSLVPGVVDAQRVGDEWIRDGARLIASRSGADCSVLASDVPQITWYSECAAYNFGNIAVADRDELLTGRDRWLLVRRDGEFQPSKEILDQYLSRVAPGPPILLRDESGAVRADLYRFAGPGG
jgi:Dolichyl-phosphate-mannose-protein mannosyltransferase